MHRHQVLYIQHAPGGEFLPLASRDESDENAGEDFLSIRTEELSRARNAGAVRPNFKTVLEQEGKPVSKEKK
jgi:hypothetical protein